MELLTLMFIDIQRQSIKLTANFLQPLWYGRRTNQNSKQFHFCHGQHIRKLLQQGKYEIFPIHNGLSEQDAQLILIHDVDFYLQTYNIQNIRKINKYSLAGFNYNTGF